MSEASLDQPQRRSLLSVPGPGLVTGAADDDPSGIGTYSQVDEQFGYSLASTMVFGYSPPLLPNSRARSLNRTSASTQKPASSMAPASGFAVPS